MNKIVLIFLLSFVSSTFAGATCTNALMSAYGFPTLSDPTTALTVTGLNHCTDLQSSGSTCCTADLINTFQTKADDLITNLSAIAAERDIFLINTRNSVMNSLQAQLIQLQNVSTLAATAITSFTSNASLSGGDSEETTLTIAAQLEALDAIIDIATDLTSNFSTLQSDFDTYQSERASCIEYVVKIQAAAWCLGCTPGASANLNGDDLDVSSSGITGLSGACFDFFSLSSTQNGVLSVHYLSSSFSAMITALDQIVAGDVEAGLTALGTASASSSSSADATSSELPPTFPDGCDETDCDWIVSTLLKGGVIDQTQLVAGGEIDTDGSRLLQERTLSTAWTPSTTEAGITVTFPTNPGNVKNGGEIYKSMISCLVIMLVGLFI